MRASCTEFSLPRSTEEPDSILRSFLNPGKAGRPSREDGGDAAAGDSAEVDWPCCFCVVLQSRQLLTNAQCSAADYKHCVAFPGPDWVLPASSKLQYTGSLHGKLYPCSWRPFRDPAVERSSVLLGEAKSPSRVLGRTPAGVVSMLRPSARRSQLRSAIGVVSRCRGR